jgi:hypothetical protein
MKEDALKVVGIVVIIGFLVFLAIKSLNIHMQVVEGLTNPDAGNSGVASSSDDYAKALQDQAQKLQDTLLISKYRTQYENTIIHMEEYISLLMLKCVLNMNDGKNEDVNMELVAKLNSLYNAKTALNDTMKFVDKK